MPESLRVLLRRPGNTVNALRMGVCLTYALAQIRRFHTKTAAGRLQSMQSIDWETHAAGTHPTWSFDAKTNTLVIRADHYRPGDAHCCISAIDVVTFRLDGARFTQTAITTAPVNR